MAKSRADPSAAIRYAVPIGACEPDAERTKRSVLRQSHFDDRLRRIDAYDSNIGR